VGVEQIQKGSTYRIQGGKGRHGGLKKKELNGSRRLTGTLFHFVIEKTFQREKGGHERHLTGGRKDSSEKGFSQIKKLSRGWNPSEADERPFKNCDGKWH